jgi:hypothetical protein
MMTSVLENNVMIQLHTIRYYWHTIYNYSFLMSSMHVIIDPMREYRRRSQRSIKACMCRYQKAAIGLLYDHII